MSRLQPTLYLSFEVTKVLAGMERDGIKIDRQALNLVKDEYTKELEELGIFLNKEIARVMGDTPINLSSPDDRSKLLFSRAVNNKKTWTNVFNLGYEVRGNTKKPKRRAYMTDAQFKRAVVNNTTVQYKTEATRCNPCKGYGKVAKRRKDGSWGTARYICKSCSGTGIQYVPTGQVAGFKLVPLDTKACSSAGFKTDADALSLYYERGNEEAVAFIKAYLRYNAIKTYLKTFVEGIEKNLDYSDRIHPQFMQCVTSTGRLSSRNPNFQNMPRGKTFPVRRAVVSRFEGGKILEGDYAQLEYRVAGYLSQDKHVYENVKGGVDVHNLTATIITGKDKEDITSEERQNAKEHTFAPLYGATGMGLPEHVHRYYYQFTEVYPGIGEWHDRLAQEALKYKVVSLPSGREYRFPYVKRTARGITHGTSVKNYPVQGFATADLLPSALVLTFEEFKKKKLKSLLCNTVHDSIVVDVHPDEEDQVIETVKECMLSIPQQAKRRWGIEYDMPVGIEIKIGSNWLDTKEIFSN